MRAIGMDPVSDTQACFRALVDAMSRPGTVHETPVGPADHAVLATLVDHEVTVCTPDSNIRTALANEGRYTEAPAEKADIVHEPDPPGVDCTSLSRGSLKEPGDGATIVYRLDDIETEKERSNWTQVTVSGPGVPGKRQLALDGFPVREARRLATAQSSYPRGVDAVLATEDWLAALPRSVELVVH